MTEAQFHSLMTRAETLAQIPERAEYFRGVRRGLRRGYYGERFGTKAEHAQWSVLDGEAGFGYRDGLAGRTSPEGSPINQFRERAARGTDGP